MRGKKRMSYLRSIFILYIVSVFCSVVHMLRVRSILPFVGSCKKEKLSCDSICIFFFTMSFLFFVLLIAHSLTYLLTHSLLTLNSKRIKQKLIQRNNFISAFMIMRIEEMNYTILITGCMGPKSQIRILEMSFCFEVIGGVVITQKMNQKI
ncbi:hypothetical protein S83_005336 [Arachis hypogaea]|nr:uncharacterized protein DS421_2g58380 [Arachis hypogaea]